MVKLPGLEHVGCVIVPTVGAEISEIVIESGVVQTVFTLNTFTYPVFTLLLLSPP